ncbi:response regulator [Gilvimarinus agarilyticus]|uniref:response regulator n=1 Tax=Gilvimarinus sp. 2_MG-2023 TaxID=3062666 RepID=UPI001C09F489|nr:response regulator [Gilvimarinus sp. 2_MG-2023]MBU2885316.1 response regulator [Gilvimarinus agarilyticus]MDO6570215.1 response regulator [Gilvimarinus sp. 2_MG-2023]
MTAAKPTLLFVDDESRILRTMEMAFRRDYNVLTSSDGRDALELLKNHAVDVIISDQRMPMMTGVEVLRGARDISPGTVRILLTGYAELASIVGSINDGEIFRYIQKPWHLIELRKTLDEAVAIARETKQAIAEPAKAKPNAGDIVVLHSKKAMAQLIAKEKPEYRVGYATTVNDAMELLIKHPKAILLTDLILPEGDISEALALMKQRRPELVVLVVTAFSDTNHLIKLINRAQVFRVLPMPLSRRMLYDSISSALKHRQSLQDKPALLRRHKVEANTDPTPEPSTNRSLMGKVRGYLERMRTSAA